MLLLVLCGAKISHTFCSCYRVCELEGERSGRGGLCYGRGGPMCPPASGRTRRCAPTEPQIIFVGRASLPVSPAKAGVQKGILDPGLCLKGPLRGSPRSQAHPPVLPLLTGGPRRVSSGLRPVFVARASLPVIFVGRPAFRGIARH